MLEQARKPLSGLAQLGKSFDRAVVQYQKVKPVPLSAAFWCVARQVAWQAKATDFDMRLSAEKRRFYEAKTQDLYNLPFYKLFERHSVGVREFPQPLYTHGQSVLMQANIEQPNTVIEAENTLRSWRFHESTRLQQVLFEGLYRYPKLCASK